MKRDDGSASFDQYRSEARVCSRFRNETNLLEFSAPAVEFKLNSRCRMLVPAIVLAISGCQTTQQQDVATNSAPNAPQVRSDASTNGIAATPTRNSNNPSTRDSYDTAPVIGSAEQKIS